MKRTLLIMPALLLTAAGIGPSPASAATRPRTLTLVFDATVNNRFLDRAPAGPSPGDTESPTSRLRDATGRFVGTAHDRCVFTKVLANDVLERCSGSATTRDGVVTLAGVGHLDSMNPPWRVLGRSGRYKGLRGEQVFAADIPLDPNVPLATGRLFSVAVITVATNRHIRAGVVPRPRANAHFIHRAIAACNATQAKAKRVPVLELRPVSPGPQSPAAGRAVLRSAGSTTAAPHTVESAPGPT